MRQFSAIEKEIIELLCRDHKTIANLVCLYLNHETVKVSHSIDDYGLTLYIKKSEFGDKALADRAFFLTERIMIIINLLKYLEYNSLIVYFKPAHGRNFLGHFTRTDDLYEYYRSHTEEYIGWQFTDEEMGQYILRIDSELIHPTEELKIHVKNKYQSKEEKRHKQTLIATWVAIFFSLFIGIFGIFQNLQSKKPELKMNEEQEKELINTIKSLKPLNPIPLITIDTTSTQNQ